MAKRQDGIAHRPFLLFSLVNGTSTVWQNILPYTRKKWRTRVHKNGLTTKPYAQGDTRRSPGFYFDVLNTLIWQVEAEPLVHQTKILGLIGVSRTF